MILGRRSVWGQLGIISYGAKYGLVSGYTGDLNVIGDYAPFVMLNSAIDFGIIAIDINLIPGAVITAGWRFDF